MRITDLLRPESVELHTSAANKEAAIDKLIGLRKYYRITGRHPGYKKYLRREHGEPTDK